MLDNESKHPIVNHVNQLLLPIQGFLNFGGEDDEASEQQTYKKPGKPFAAFEYLTLAEHLMRPAQQFSDHLATMRRDRHAV